MKHKRLATVASGSLATILERERREARAEGPTWEREQHSRVTRDDKQIIDARGDIGAPWQAESLLGQLREAKVITLQERLAGEEFARLFRLACHDTLQASDPARAVVDVGRGTWGPGGSDWARARVREAINAVGGFDSPGALACWYVLGLEMSLRQFEGMARYLDRRPLDRKEAKGALIQSLAVLARHFGYISEIKG
jgi:hypothetical protein